VSNAGELAHEPESAGIWIAYHGDWSGMNVFADEITCLRHAVENSMLVKFVEYGASLR
jgi:hypothetical protein